MDRSESEVHFSTLARPLNLVNHPRRGCAGSRLASAADHSSQMGLRIRSRAISIRSARGNHHNQPGGNGPSRADRAGDRRRPHQAFRPLSSNITSTSVAQQCSTPIARNLGRSSLFGDGSPPDALIEKRERASAMELSLPAMWSATTVQSEPISYPLVSRADLVNWLDRLATGFAHATAVA